MIKTKVNLVNMERALKKAKNPYYIIAVVGERLKLLVQQRWDKGFSAGGKKMPRLTTAYKKQKKESGRKGIRNLSYTGAMRQSLYLKKISRFSAKLRFQNPEIPKARGNLQYAKNFMKPVSNKVNKELQKLAFTLWNKK